MQTFNRKLFYTFITFALCINVSVSYAGKIPKELAKGVMSYTKGEQKYGQPECAGKWSPKGKSGEKRNMVKACKIVKGAKENRYEIKFKDVANEDYGPAVSTYPGMDVIIKDGWVWVVGNHGWWSSEGTRKGCYNVKFVWTLLLAPPDKDDCPKGEAYDRTLEKCRPFCKRDQTFDKKLGKCVPRCPKGQEMDERLGGCREKCTDGKGFDYKLKICRHPCSPDQTFDSRLGKCRVRCSEGERYDHRLGKCRELCPPGQSFDKYLGKCRKPNPSDQTYDEKELPIGLDPSVEIMVVKGKIYSRTRGKFIKKWEKIYVNELIEVKSAKGRVFYKSGKGGYGGIMILSGGAQIVVKKESPKKKSRFKLIRGALWNIFQDNPYGGPHIVISGTIVNLTPDGTEFFVSVNKSENRCVVIKGQVRATLIQDANKKRIIKPGEELVATREGTMNLHRLSKRDLIYHEKIFAQLEASMDKMYPKYRQSEESDSWEPIHKDQTTFNNGQRNAPKDAGGWESIQPQESLHRRKKGRFSEDEPLTSEEKNSSY